MATVILEFAVTDSYAVPYDLDTYSFLRSKGIYSTKLRESYLDSLSDLFKVEVTKTDLKDLVDEAISKTEKYWSNKAEGTAKVEIKSANSFVIFGTLNEANKELLRKIEQTWKKFFVRWGFHFDVLYDETPTRCKITFNYEFLNQPEIEVEEESIHEEVDLDQRLTINGILELKLIEFEDKNYIQVRDMSTDKTLYNLDCNVRDYGLLPKLINFSSMNN